MAGNITVTTNPDDGVKVVQIQLPGAPGPQGMPGVPGPGNVLTIGTVTTTAPGSNGSATITGVSPNQALNLTIPQGPAGANGAAGPPNTLTIGTVNTVAATTGASATITGIAPNQTLNLVIPRGYGVIPAGGQYDVLVKNSGTDYDTAWETPTGTGSLVRKSYADSGDSTTLTSANSHADTGDTNTLASANSHADTGDTNTLASAKSYADTQDATNLATAKSYADTQDAALGASAATVNKLIRRDANGRAQVVDPALPADIATKNYVDTSVAGVSGGTATGVTAATPNTLVERDANGGTALAYLDTPYGAPSSNPATGSGRLFVDSTSRSIGQLANGGGIYYAHKHLGSGTAFPTQYIASGDTFFRTDIGTSGTLFRYNAGLALWRCELVVCTHATQPSATNAATFSGMLLYETDTQNVYIYQGDGAHGAFKPLNYDTGYAAMTLGSPFTAGSSGQWYRIVGKLVQVHIDLNYNGSYTNGALLATVPATANSPLHINAVTYAGGSVPVMLNTNGQLTFFGATATYTGLYIDFTFMVSSL